MNKNIKPFPKLNKTTQIHLVMEYEFNLCPNTYVILNTDFTPDIDFNIEHLELIKQPNIQIELYSLQNVLSLRIENKSTKDFEIKKNEVYAIYNRG
jgi:hypothetical protein